MAENFDLDSYRCAGPPEGKLWKVRHWNSQFTRDPASGDIIAADSTRKISTESDLKQALRNHWDWKCAKPSCFQSTFGCPQHARNWANKRYGTTQTYEIDIKKLPADTYVFSSEHLADKLDIDFQYSKNEYLFLHRIPGPAIEGNRVVDGRKEEEDDNHGDNYESDGEGEERDCMEALVEMMQGKWL